MTSATDKTGCLSHRPNTHFFVMFEDFLDVAKVSEHQYKLAAFWRVMETKTNDRISYNEKVIEDAKKQGIPEPETNLWIEIPYSEFVKRACGVFKASSFQVAAAESERLGFSESRIRKRPRNPLDSDSPLEEYKEYRFNTEGMQSVLNGGEYPTPIEINSPLLNSIATRKKKRAVENNTTPIDFNSTPIKNNKGRRETPIKNNSTPLLKTIGNNISTVSSSEYEKDEDDTYPRDSQTLDDSGSRRPTHAPSTHAYSEEASMSTFGPKLTQFFEDAVASAKQVQDSPDHDRTDDTKGNTHAHASGTSVNRPAAAHENGTRVAQDVQADECAAGSVTETPSQLSTSQQGYPQAGAQVRGSARPALVVSNAPLFAPTGISNRAQFTELGRQVCEWYEIIQATKVRRTNVNINACNGLAEEDGISFENLKLAIEHWETHSYVKERNIPIDLQKLEDPSGAFTFAKAMLAIKAAQRMAAQRRTTQQTTVLPSHHSQTDDEYYASLRRTRA